MYGTRNSTCSLKLPSNFSLVMMLPPLTTSIAPPSTSFQCAAVLPSVFVQLSRLLPSNRTIASLGGGVLLTSTLSSGLFNFRSPMSPYCAGDAPARSTTATAAPVKSRVRMRGPRWRVRVSLDACCILSRRPAGRHETRPRRRRTSFNLGLETGVDCAIMQADHPSPTPGKRPMSTPRTCDNGRPPNPGSPARAGLACPVCGAEHATDVLRSPADLLPLILDNMGD